MASLRRVQGSRVSLSSATAGGSSCSSRRSLTATATATAVPSDNHNSSSVEEEKHLQRPLAAPRSQRCSQSSSSSSKRSMNHAPSSLSSSKQERSLGNSQSLSADGSRRMRSKGGPWICSAPLSPAPPHRNQHSPLFTFCTYYPTNLQLIGYI